MLRILAALTLLLILAACDVGSFPGDADGGSSADGSSQTNLSYDGDISQDVQVCIGCHGPSVQQGGFRVDSYASIMLAVDVNDPTGSTLAMEFDPDQSPRVEHSALATATRHQLFVDWISAGAPEN